MPPIQIPAPALAGDILIRLRANRSFPRDAPLDPECALAGSPDVTAVLLEATDGAAGATDRLLYMVYGELRALAGNYLWHESPDHTLQATELVHEAYLRLIDHTRCEWRNRAHFLAVAAVAMRRILIDHARRRRSQKQGGSLVQVSLDEALVVGTEESDETLLALERALERLAISHPEPARVFEMRFFGGLTFDECASVLGISARTASRHWEFAKAWLSRELGMHDASG